MKFVLNNYNIRFTVQEGDPPPVVGAHLVRLPFGIPSFEQRPIWLIEVEDLDALLRLIGAGQQSIEISLSAYWQIGNEGKPIQRLYGIALIDEPEYSARRDDPIPLPRS